MLWLTAAALASGAALLLWIRTMSAMARRLTDYAGLTALFAVFVLAGSSITETLLHDTVFMTEVHKFLLHPLFLIGTAYLGPYLLARMAALAGKEEG